MDECGRSLDKTRAERPGAAPDGPRACTDFRLLPQAGAPEFPQEDKFRGVEFRREAGQLGPGADRHNRKKRRRVPEDGML